jgi:hypothetical protein
LIPKFQDKNFIIPEIVVSNSDGNDEINDAKLFLGIVKK